MPSFPLHVQTMIRALRTALLLPLGLAVALHAGLARAQMVDYPDEPEDLPPIAAPAAPAASAAAPGDASTTAAAAPTAAPTAAPATTTEAALPDAPPPVDPRQVQTAVSGALKWLADHQILEGPDAGSWDAPEAAYRPAVAGLAGLAFLANGHMPGEGPYGAVVDRAMRYVMATATPDGYIGQGNKSGMYIHAICALFGLSYLGMSPAPETDPALAEWCRRAVQVTLDAQMVRRSGVARGGWRYTPDTAESDLSVTSWQLLVLHAARQCGYVIDNGVIEGALRYVNTAYKEDENGGAGYLYRPGVSTEVEPAATGVAVFVKAILEPRRDERTDRVLAYLATYPPTWGGRQYGNYFYFASFYMAQGMFQIGGSHWADYNARLQPLLLEHQAGDGAWPFPADNTPQSRLAGPAYPTAMAVLILSLDRQYLPMYQRQSRLY